MRWKYAHLDPEPRPEPGRSAVQTSIDDFWQSFASRTQDLDDFFAGRASWDLPRWMQESLNPIHPGLMWEYGPGLAGGHRLVVTPEVQRHLRPLVDHLLACAPAIDGWEFYGHRLREPYERLAPTVSGRCSKDLFLNGAVASRGDLNRVDVTFTRSRKLFGPSHEEAMNQALVTVETLLGEQCFDEWVGIIDVQTKVSEPVLLPSLPPAFDAVIADIRAGLPSQPFFRRLDDLQWELRKLEEGPARKLASEARDDYPRQDDLLVAVYSDPELWRAARNDNAFTSKRFSRHGETYCYLKIDGAEGPTGFQLQDRTVIEDAINAALVAQELGCAIGGGTGLRYSYIDLAILDLERSIPIIQSVLQRGGAPARTWLLFFDSELQSEWVRMRPDTPEPP